jgi:hypothetical protein
MKSKSVLVAIGLGVAALVWWLVTPSARRSDAASARATTGAVDERGADALVSTPTLALPQEPLPRTALEVTTPDIEIDDGVVPRIQVRGRVHDTRGQALERVEITVAQRSFEVDQDIRAALSSHSGVLMAPDGTFTFSVAESPIANELEFHVDSEGCISRTIRADPRLFLDIELVRLPVLTGRMLEEQGAAITAPGGIDAEVLDARDGRSSKHSAQLEADGTYRIVGLPQGRLVGVVARARGFATRAVTLERTLVVDEIQELDLTLKGGAAVSGVVLDSHTRQPIADARVWLGSADEPHDGAIEPKTRTDAHGRFELIAGDAEMRVRAGEPVIAFPLVAKAEGYCTAPQQSFGAHENAERNYSFEILLMPARSLSLQALLPSRKPVRLARIWSIDAVGNSFAGNTDRDGRHTFTSLPAGRFVLWLHEQGMTIEGSFKPIHNGTRELDFDVQFAESFPRLHALRTELELVNGEAREVELVLEPPGSGRIVGSVVDLHGTPVAGCKVRARFERQAGAAAPAGDSQEETSDAKGRYRFRWMHPGRYQVWAEGGEGAPCALRQRQIVDVESDGDVTCAAFVVGPCMTIEGRVEPGTVDVHQLELVARDPVGSTAYAATRPDANGAFRFEPLIASEFEVVLLHDGDVVDRVTVVPSSAAGLVLRAH